MRALIVPGLLAVLAACTPAAGSQSPQPTIPVQATSDQVPETAKDTRLPATVVPKPTATVRPQATPLPTGPKAPAINNTVWLNTEPLTPDQLNGRVVLIDFWTFG
jgi:hypothetical protein